MEILHIQIIETSAVVFLYFIFRLIVKKTVERTVVKSMMHNGRGKIIKKAINLIILCICITAIIIVWGIDQTQLYLFIGSVLTVVGIALFAQWSILSNITSGIIIFFSHSVKLNDTISIIDKDFNVEGRVSDIGLFFVILKTEEGEQITLPNNVFIQKMIKKKAVK